VKLWTSVRLRRAYTHPHTYGPAMPSTEDTLAMRTARHPPAIRRMTRRLERKGAQTRPDSLVMSPPPGHSANARWSPRQRCSVPMRHDAHMHTHERHRALPTTTPHVAQKGRRRSHGHSMHTLHTRDDTARHVRTHTCCKHRPTTSTHRTHTCTMQLTGRPKHKLGQREMGER